MTIHSPQKTDIIICIVTQDSQQLSLAVKAVDAISLHQAGIIAEQLGCTVCDNSDLHELVLTVQYIPASNIFSLELTVAQLNPPLKLLLDFNSDRSQYRKQSGGGKRQHLVRATGLHKQQGLRILDATAGLGGDSFVLACNSASMTLAEQHPVLTLMLENAIARASDITKLTNIASRMKVCTALNSIDLLELPETNKTYDVIYLDPMYPSTHKKQAKARKSMQIIQYLLRDFDHQPDQLLQAALNSGVKRIVVKRPAGAEPLLNKPPQSTIESANTRYDIYMQH